MSAERLHPNVVRPETIMEKVEKAIEQGGLYRQLDLIWQYGANNVVRAQPDAPLPRRKAASTRNFVGPKISTIREVQDMLKDYELGDIFLRTRGINIAMDPSDEGYKPKHGIMRPFQNGHFFKRERLQ